MAIHHVTFSSAGGAGMVAKLLVEEQQKIGLDARLHTQTDKNLWEQPFRFPVLTLKAAVDHYVISNHSQPTQFSLLRDTAGQGLNIELEPDDILHLHWIAGMITPAQLKELSNKVKKIIWTLHDMEPFTGGCHHAHGCHQFEQGCSACPQARSPFHQLIRHALKEKTKALTQMDNLEIVAPTIWMANKAKKSQVFKQRSIKVIHNPIAEYFFNKQSSKASTRNELNIPLGDFVAVFIADDLDNPSKHVHEAVDVFLNNSTSKSSKHALLIGKSSKDYSLNSQVTTLGSLSSQLLARYASAADIHISMSTAESAGLTIAETAALGIPSVVRAGSGMSDIISEGATGFAVKDFSALVDCLGALMDNQGKLIELSQRASKQAKDRFQLSTIQKNYEKLYAK